MASLADALAFLKAGFDNQGPGAITKYGDGFSSVQTNNINEYGPIPQQKQAPVIVVDPSSMPIDLRDFTGAGSVDQNAMQSQDNMQPIDRVAAGVKTGDTPAQAASKTANAKKSAIGTEDFTKGVVDNPKSAVPTKVADIINLDPYGYGTSVAPPSNPVVANQVAAASPGFAEDAPTKAQPQTDQQNMAYAEDAPQKKFAANPKLSDIALIDGDKLTGAGAGLGGAALATIIALATRGRAKPQAIMDALKTGKLAVPQSPKFLEELAKNQAANAAPTIPKMVSEMAKNKAANAAPPSIPPAVTTTAAPTAAESVPQLTYEAPKLLEYLQSIRLPNQSSGPAIPMGTSRGIPGSGMNTPRILTRQQEFQGVQNRY